MPTPENRSPMPTPERVTVEQLEHEANVRREKGFTDAAHEAESLEQARVQAQMRSSTEAASARERAAGLAATAAAGGPATETKKVTSNGKSRLEKGAEMAIKIPVAAGLAGSSAAGRVYDKLLKPVVDAGWEKVKAGWQWLDVWDLSGSKERAKTKKK